MAVNKRSRLHSLRYRAIPQGELALREFLSYQVDSAEFAPGGHAN